MDPDEECAHPSSRVSRLIHCSQRKPMKLLWLVDRKNRNHFLRQHQIDLETSAKTTQLPGLHPLRASDPGPRDKKCGYDLLDPISACPLPRRRHRTCRLSNWLCPAERFPFL